jgi:hypothetical protein
MIFKTLSFFEDLYIYQHKANQKTEQNYTFHLV